MELRVLQYFLTVTREMTISGAAEQLHITQPTLSRQMKELEDEVGKQLFVRGNRSIILTNEGLLLKKRAEEIIHLVEKTQKELASSDLLLNGDIYIGAGESEGMRIVAKAINKMQSKYPLVKFHIFSGNADDVMDKLDKGLVDFGVLIEPVDMSKYDFLKLPIMCSNQQLVKNEFAGWLGGNDRKLNIISTYNLLYNASLVVEEGDKYALCLDHIINNSMLCFKPLEPKLEVGINIAWKKYQLFSKASEYFLMILHEEIKKYA